MSQAAGDLLWPAERLADALARLAAHAGLPVRAVEVQRSPPPGAAPAQLSAWIASAAAELGVHAEEVVESWGELERLIRGGGPALIRVGERGGFLVLLEARRGRARLLAADLTVRQAEARTVASWLTPPFPPGIREPILRMLERAGVPQARRAGAAEAVLRQRLTLVQVGGAWLVGPRLGEPVLPGVRRLGAAWRLGLLVAVQAAQQVLWVGAWALLGRMLLGDRVDPGWVWAWGLCLASLVPMRAAAGWLEGRLALEAGAALRQRLMVGALRMDPERLRHEGAGQLLGRTIECDAVERLSLSGAFLALSGALELAAGVAVTALGGGGPAQLAALGLCLLGLAVLAFRSVRARAAWTDLRLAMTHDLVERIVGHRTRLAQQEPERRHDGEDEAVDRYLEASRRLDRAAVLLQAVPRAWMVVGVASLSAAFASDAVGVEPLAVALGGILLCQSALAALAHSVEQLSAAALAWRRVRPLVEAAAAEGPPPVPGLAPGGSGAGGEVLLEGGDLSFRYRRAAQPALSGCSLVVRRGDRILLEGPSGGGKSTLAAVLAGLRAPESGLLLLGGVDRPTLGDGSWRRRVVLVPQFHENHVVSATMAFNLLLGRGWPPEEPDLAEARQVCAELGLGPLLERMPAGLGQTVGETGWQLSHGERSRVYLARALLQGADVVILDESFASLDPETLERAMRCVRQRAETLLVIAHP